MLDFLKWRQQRGAAPGSLIYAGKKRDFEPTLKLLPYSAEGVGQQSDISPHSIPHFPDKTNLLTITGVHDPVLIQTIGDRFEIPKLLLEDIMDTGQRPKVDWEEDPLCVVVKDVVFDEEHRRLEQEQISIYVHEEKILLFLEGPTKRFDGVLQRIRIGRQRMLEGGAGYLMAALLDAVIDNYYTTLSGMSDKAEQLEAALYKKQTEDSLNELYLLRRESIILRNVIFPVRDMMGTLVREEDGSFNSFTCEYLRDVSDHATQMAESVQALIDILTGMIELQVSLMGMRMNRIMHVLTLIGSIFIPLTFITGLYGMNFDNMPELHTPHGYFIVLGVMGVIVGGMLVFFKHNDWL